MTNPKLSIIITTYKRFEKLKMCLWSLYSLLRNNSMIEVIVANDNPEDKKLVQKFLNKFNENLTNPVIQLTHDTNLGVFLNRALSVSEVKGDYFTFVDDDDMLDSMVIDHWFRRIYNDTQKEIISVDAYIYSTAELYHNLKDGSFQLTDKFLKAKNGKAFIALSGSIIRSECVQPYMENYLEFLSTLDHSKNIGDDRIFYNYFRNVTQSISKEVAVDEVLYLANYDKSVDHMMLTNPKENTAENIKQYYNYIEI